MTALLLLCFLTALVGGCAGDAPPTAATSSSQPALAEVASVPEQILAVLKDLPPAQAVEKRDQWGIPEVAVYCAGTGKSPEEALLACQWGKGYNAMQDGWALFWWDRGAWKAQPYPPEGILGRGDFHGLRREGDLLQVVMNVARGETRTVEQVGLLQHVGGRWQAVWGPKTSSPYPLLSVLFQPHEGIDRYTLFRDEGGVYAREDWERKGATYRQTSRVELSTEEYTVVRFALALLADNGYELSHWSVSEALNLAQSLNMTESLQEGFTTQASIDGGMVRIAPANRADGWDLTVTQESNFWKVTTIEPAPVVEFNKVLLASRAVLGDLAKHYRTDPQRPEFQAGLAEIARKREALDRIEEQFEAGTVPVSQLLAQMTKVMQWAP